MKTTIRLAAIALSFAAAGAAFANGDEPTLDVNVRPVALKSRADVQAEFNDFAKGGIHPWAVAYDPVTTVETTKSRSQIRAEVIAAREAGKLTAPNGEDSLARHGAASGTGLQLAGSSK